MPLGLGAIVGLGVQAGSAVMSFAQANKQKKAQQKADQQAQKFLKEARQKLEVNFMDALAINKEPYEREREALLAAGAQAMQAGIESERGGAATAGRILASQQQAQGDVRDQMNKDLFNLEAAKLKEDSRLRDMNANLDLQEVAGAQQAAAEAEENRMIALNQGIQSGVSALAQGIKLPELYKMNTTQLKNSIGGLELTPEQMKSIGNIEGSEILGAAGTGDFTNLDLEKVKGMTNREFKDFLSLLTNEQKSKLLSASDYNPFNF